MSAEKKKDYENYLLNFCSWQKEHDDYIFEIYVGFFDTKNLSRTEYIDGDDGVWSVSEYNGNSFILKLKYTKNEHYFDETLNKNFYGLIDSAIETKVAFYLKDSNGRSIYDYVGKILNTADAWRANQNVAIKCGVSSKDTKYERQYHDYWNPIMVEHQKKADTMK